MVCELLVINVSLILVKSPSYSLDRCVVLLVIREYWIATDSITIFKLICNVNLEVLLSKLYFLHLFLSCPINCPFKCIIVNKSFVCFYKLRDKLELVSLCRASPELNMEH